MKRTHAVIAATLALALGTGAALACDGAPGKTVKAVSSTAYSCSAVKAASLSASSCTAAKAGALTASGACVATHVVYRVGDVDTFDKTKALELAEDGTVRFVVAGTVYEDETAAKMAMTESIHSRLGEMLAISTTVGGETYQCSASAARTAESTGKALRYVVAGREFLDRSSAEAFLARALAAVESVSLVDGEGRPIEGCALSHAKKTGLSAFKVGESEIHCPVTANLSAAQAKIAAIASVDA